MGSTNPAGGILQSIGGEVEAYGQIRAGQIAKNIHEFNAQAITETANDQVQALEIARQLGERNAAMAEQDALFAKQVAAFNERRFRTQFAAQQSQARAMVGASGVTFEGSPLAVLANSAREAEMDAMTIRFQGELAARAKTEEARLLRYQASLRPIEAQQVRRAAERGAILERYAGSEALLGGYLGATGTLLKTYGNIVATGGFGGGKG